MVAHALMRQPIIYVTVQTGFSYVTLPEQSIHLREKQKRVLPCEIKKALAFLSLQKGPAFFDEDDVCAGLRNSVAARLNCHLITD